MGSRAGYNLIFKRTQHFGYYPDGVNNISLRQALELQEKKLADKLNPKSGQRILDAGCGQGLVALNLAEKFDIHIEAIDIVPHALNTARKLGKERSLDNKVNFQLMDCTEPIFPAQSFDAIYTMETLSHAFDLESTLDHFYKLLKPGGRLVLFEYTIAEESKFPSYEKKVVNAIVEKSLTGLKEFKHDQFKMTLGRHGFLNITEEVITDNTIPTFNKLYKIAYLPYQVVKLFHLQKHFINITGTIESYNLIKKGLLRYCIFTAIKPRESQTT